MLGFSLGLSWTRARSVDGTFVIALLGQSNMVGRPSFDGGSVHPGTVRQLGREAPNTGVVIPASVPLEHLDPQAGDMGLDIAFSQAWSAQNPGAELVLLPEAQGGTGLLTGHWRKGGSCYEGAVARINALMAAEPDYIFAGFLWHQGESDAGNAQYQTQLDQMIADLRADVVVAGPETPFVLGQISPGWIAGNTDREAVQNIISDTPARVAHTAVVSSAGLTVIADGVHFDAASMRALGARYAATLPQAIAGTGQPITGPQPPIATGSIPDQTDTLEQGSGGGPPPLAPPIAQGIIPDQQDTADALAPPTAQGSIPDQQDEVSP